MTNHKFDIGEVVSIHVSRFAGAPPGPFEVTRQLPPTGRSNQYRVKSHQNGQERVVLEEDMFRTDR